MNKHIVYTGLLLMVTADSCDRRQETATISTPAPCIITPELKKRITLETVSSMPVTQELELTGSVSYDQDHLYKYQSLVSGVVQRVLFKTGDYVQKGQVLAEVSTTELSGQKSELLKAEAELKLAQRKLDATTQLYDDGIASEKEQQEATNELSAARAEVNRIREVLALQGGNIKRGQLLIKAPLSGYVVEKKITAGSQIDAGEDDLFVLSDLTKVWVMANVYAAQLERVKAGQQVDIQTTAYPGRIFSGRISRMSNVFDAEERVLKAIIELDNRELLLKPSMMVQINVYQPAQEHAMAIPKNAVLFIDNAYHVLLYRNDCEVEIKDITPAGDDRKFYYINDGSIQDQDQIISKNHLLIYNKLKER